MMERSEQENGTFQKVFRTMENDDVVFRNGNAVLVAKPLTVVRALTSTGGARVLATPPNLNPNSDEFDSCETPMIKVKDEPQELEREVKTVIADSQSAAAEVVSEERRSMLSFDDFLKATNTQVASVDESLKSMEVESTKMESADVDVVCETQESIKLESVDESLKSMEVEPPIRTAEEEVTDVNVACETQESVKVEPVKETTPIEPVGPVYAEKQAVSDDEVEVLKVVKGKQAVSDEVKVLKVVKKETVEEKKILIPNLDDGDFPVEPGWSLLGSKVEVATSMAKGVRRLVDNEIVYFDFPNPHASYKFQWIVRVSTKRSGVVLILSLIAMFII
jgi:DNA repair protein RAD5